MALSDETARALEASRRDFAAADRAFDFPELGHEVGSSARAERDALRRARAEAYVRARRAHQDNIAAAEAELDVALAREASGLER